MNKSIIEISQPVGKIDVPAGAIVESDAQRNANRYVPIGRFDSKLRTTKMDEHGISPIGMNQSGVLALKPEENGIIATCSLAGCIGLAGFAKLQNGELLLLISHADAISQQYKMAGRGSDVVKQMYTFEHDTREALGGVLVVVFPSDAKENPSYQDMEGAYETLHYLRRIEVAATQMRDHLKIILIPYEIHSYGHTLAAGRLNSKEGVFFDGVFIDTKLSFNTPEVKPDSHLSR